MTDLNDLLIFSKVAELQGISPAARALRMPKSKVSRRMAALEDDLGVRLLERSTRSVRLTEVGEVYVRHCRRIAEEVASARESVHHLLEAPRGLLRISTSVTTGQYLLAPHVGEFMAEYPEVELEINLSNRRVDVIAEGFDLVVRVGKLQDSTLVSKRLYTDRLALFASPDYLERFGIPTQLSELSKHRLLIMSDTNKPEQWMLVGPKNQAETIPVHPYATVNDLSMIRRIALDGGGVALLPGYLSETAEQSARLRRVLPAWRTPPFSYYALYPSHRGVTLKARAWLDFIANKLKNTSKT